MIIYYNARCSKCREALHLLEDANCEFEIREYLKVPPTKIEIKELLQKLNCNPIDIVRKNEPLFIEKFKDKKISKTQWIQLLSENPILIERPIVIDGDKAVIGRPPILVLDFVATKTKNKSVKRK